MSKPCDGDALGDRRPVVVVLRLVLDQRGELLHGEVVDASGRLRGRFAGWDGLVRALRAWLRGVDEE